MLLFQSSRVMVDLVNDSAVASSAEQEESLHPQISKLHSWPDIHIQRIAGQGSRYVVQDSACLALLDLLYHSEISGILRLKGLRGSSLQEQSPIYIMVNLSQWLQPIQESLLESLHLKLSCLTIDLQLSQKVWQNLVQYKTSISNSREVETLPFKSNTEPCQSSCFCFR